jgi:hypothetical protein
MYSYTNPYYIPTYSSPQPMHTFPMYPQSEIAAKKIKAPLYPSLKWSTLQIIQPFVQYGMKEAKNTSFEHALTEVAAMTYLIGKGFDPQTAYFTVESWEINEKL